MGVHQPKVSEWLNGNRIPNSESLYKLADVLNEDPYALASKLETISKMQNNPPMKVGGLNFDYI